MRAYSPLKLVVFLFVWLIFRSPESLCQSASSANPCSIDSVNVTTPDCNGQCNGTIQIFAQGTGTVFYQWPEIPGASTSSVSGLCSGTYSVIITDSTGCEEIDTILVEQPDPIAFSLSAINTTCPGGCSGSVTVTPLDTIPFTIQWPGFMTTGPTLSNICQGVYAVILTNPQGCTAYGSAEVGYDPPFDLNFSTTTASCLTSCNGTATVFATGIPPFNYQWGTGPIQNTQQAVNLCSGNLMVSVSDSTGCVVSDSVTIPLAIPPIINFTSVSPVCFGGCNGQATVIVFGSGNYEYEWNTFPVQDSSVATGLCSGYYSVQITDLLNGCLWYDSVFVSDPPPSSISINAMPSFCENFCSGFALVSATGPGPFTYLWQSGATTQADDSLCPGIHSVTVTDSLGCSSSAFVTILAHQLIFSVSDANCNNICDGVAEVFFPTTAGWQATWQTIPVQTTPVVTQLCSGTYTVEIIDTGGCQITGTVLVEELQPITTNYSITPITCPGLCNGAIAMQLSGSDPFVIQWNSLPGQTSDSVSQLCYGIYPVTITDSAGCSRVDSILVPEPAIPQFSYNTIANSCYNLCDASAAISPLSPGTFTYEWMTTPPQFGASAAGLCPDFTVVHVTDSTGCTFIDSVLILGTPDIYIDISLVEPSCFGTCDGFAAIQVYGGTPNYDYFWSNGFTTPQAINLCAGTYTVTVMDANGCIDSNMVILDDPDPISVSFSVTDATCAACADGVITATVSGGTPNYYYYWTPGGIGGASIDSLAPGSYNLCVADDNLCIQCFDTIVSFTNALQENVTLNNAVTVFPNPFTTNTSIRMADTKFSDLENVKLEVFDVWGRIVNGVVIKSANSAGGYSEININAAAIAPGMYLFKLTDGIHSTFTGRLMIQQ